MLTASESRRTATTPPGFDGVGTFAALRDGFDRAAERHPRALTESFYTFAGESVRVRIVGRALAEGLGQPFSHVRCDALPAAPPRLTIDLWDENEEDVPRQPRQPRERPGWSQITADSPDGRFAAQRLPNTLTCLDRDAARIVGSIAWSDRIFIYERGKPLTRPLAFWHHDRDVPVIHAGLVASAGRGVLLAGRSGSGKSTVALAALCGGLQYLGEDYVGLQDAGDGSFVGHSLYGSAFLNTHHMARFPALAPHAIGGPPADEKSLVLLSHVFPDRLRRAVAIRAVALPRVVDRDDSTVRPATRGQALLALAPSSLVTIPGSRPRGIDKLAGLVEQVPCYWLDLGSDLASLPDRLEELLREACA